MKRTWPTGRNLEMRWIFLLQAGLTGLAAAFLILAPPLLPSGFGVHLDREAWPICYILGAAELSIAFLSLGTLTLEQPRALHLIGSYFMVFHISSGLLGLAAISRGFPLQILANAIPHFFAAALFAAFVGSVRRRAMNACAPILV